MSLSNTMIDKPLKYFLLTCFILFFITLTRISYAQEKVEKSVSLRFEVVKIHASEESIIYRVSELNGHLASLGIEVAIHSLVEIKKNGVLIVDPGPHPRYASELLSSVKKFHKKKLPPVKWVFNSTGKPENVMGNTGFFEVQPLYLSSIVTAKVMRAKCEQCRIDMFKAISEPDILDKPIIYPSYFVYDHQILHPQLLDWKVFTFECAKNTGDTVLWNSKAGILYAGRMVHSGNLPSLVYTNTREWIKGLIALENLKPDYVIGSGGIGSSKAFNKNDITITKNYISSLLTHVELDFNLGGNGSNADSRLKLPNYNNLLGYSQRHPLNVQHIWRELEIAEFGEQKVCNKKYFHESKLNSSKPILNQIAPKNELRVKLKEILPGTYVFTGKIDDFSKANLGNISNYGFIVGNDCVAVIDTGGSYYTGEIILASIRAKTQIPICYVINTHAHPDHIGGNSVFFNLNPKPEFVVHRKFEAALSSRFKIFNKRMRELLGLNNVVVLEPISREVKDYLEIDLGGRKLFLKAWNTSHTDNDLTIYDDLNEVLWSGDLLFIDHMPVLDGNLINWIKITKELTKSSHPGSNGKQVKFIVPGHGDYQRINSPKLRIQEEYLTNLLFFTRKAIKEGTGIREAVENISIKTNGEWLLSELFNKRNVTAAYAELEWED